MFFNPFYYPYWWITIPGLLLGLYAQFKLMSTYGRYLEVPARSGLSGAEAAREILDHAGLTDIPVERIPGRLTDHFDPGKRALFLSEENYDGRSVAAVGVAAHEAGHALQQQAAYALFNFRMWLVPVTQFSSMATFGLILLSCFITGFLGHKLFLIAIVLFAVATLFQIVTLPVEHDASRRAKQQLIKLGLVQADEAPAVSNMLHAAELTYVAAMLAGILELLRLILIFNRSNRD